MEFKDFWSINRWLCQYYFEGDKITMVVIVAPMDAGMYSESDRFRGWLVADFEAWLYELDQNTVGLCTLPDGTTPGIEMRVFPCADGYFYAAYPANYPERPGQIYELVVGGDTNLGENQQLISDAGRRLWLQISYLLSEAQKLSSVS